MRSIGDTLRSRGYVFFYGQVVNKEKEDNILIALFVDRARVRDCQKAGINVKRNIFLDEGRFAAVEIDQRYSRGG